MSRTDRYVTLCLVLALAACDTTPRDAGDPAAPALSEQDQSPIGADVLAAVRRGEAVNVVVALEAERTTAIAALRQSVRVVRNEVLDAVEDQGVVMTRAFTAVPAFAARVTSENAVRRLAEHPRVRRIDLDVGGTGMLGASVPYIGANQRHALGNQGEGVVVGVIDSGIDTDHPDLIDDVGAQACFGNRTGPIDGVGFCPNGSDRQVGPGAAEDDAGHGTHVSGIVTSRGVVGSPGAAPGANIVAIKVLDNCSFAGCFYFFSEIVAALDYVINNNATLGIRIINMSLGTGAQFPGNCDNSTAFNMAGAAAVNTLRNMGVIIFASAGNNGSGVNMGSPACLSNVVSVGATDNNNNVAAFSQSNSTTDIFGPGVSVRSMARGGGTTIASGTSMASPHAAGCAALLIESGEATTPAAIEARLETSPFQVTDPTNNLTFPRIDCSPIPIQQVAMDLSPSTISLANTPTTNAILLSSATFNATTVGPAFVRMRINGANDVVPATRAGVVITSLRDWNGDGLVDRLISFRTADLVAAGLNAAAPNLFLRDNISATRWEARDPILPAFVP